MKSSVNHHWVARKLLEDVRMNEIDKQRNLEGQLSSNMC